MKRVITFLTSITMVLLIIIMVTARTAFAQTTPSFNILQVIKDKSVTIKTSDFPANDTFTVTMGAFGTLGMDGELVGTTQSGNGGSFQETYTIPSSLAGSERIAIRLQSPTSGFFAYNWFWNNTATVTPPATSTPAPTPTPRPTTIPSTYTGFPTFFIVAVVQNQTVTIKGVNFPPNDTFDVLIGAFGTEATNGINVSSTNSGVGGSLTAMYKIPASLADSTRLAIRLQSPTSGYFAFNWFWNNTTTP